MMVGLVGQLDVSRETYEKLRTFESIVQKWSPKINLVSRDALAEIWTRHILDSAQLFELSPPRTGPWLDIGSGGGFPGIVVAILLAELSPKQELIMIESDQRKATFLRTALRECGVAGTVHPSRIEEIGPQNAAVMTARALASVDTLLSHAEKHLGPDGIALLHKGRNYAREIEDARANWSFETVLHPSQTSDDSCILEIRNIHRANAE